MKHLASPHHHDDEQEHRRCLPLIALICAGLGLVLLPGLALAAGDLETPLLKFRSLAPELNLAPPSSLSSPLADKDRRSSLAPRSLAAGDLDHDGLPELVMGCEDAGRGALVVYRGSRSTAAATALPFAEVATEYATPEPAELVAVGDFNADGHNDLVITSTGNSSLLLLAGDGAGGLTEPQIRELPGRVTDLVSGEVNRRDGLPDLVLALADDGGAAVLVLESPKGAFFADGEVFPFAAPVTGLALGQLDEELTREVVVSTGSEVVVIRGRDRRLSQARQRQLEVGKAVLDKVALPEPAVSLVAANLEGDHQDEVAALTADGAFHLISRAAKGAGWQRQELATSLATAQGCTLKVASLSTSGHAELLLTEPSGMTLLGVTTPPAKQGEQPELRRLARVDAEARPLATLALRLDRDALDDLVLVLEGTAAPFVLRSAARTTYPVNTTDDNDDGLCNDTHCSLREAINAANVSTDLDTINIAISSESNPIQPLTPLPAIVHGVTINGWHGIPKLTRAVLDGSLCSGGTCHGLQIDSSKVTLDGLVIKSFPNDGVHISGNQNKVIGCRIGTNAAGNTAAPNSYNGITILDGENNVIGGSTAADTNLVSGNYGKGISIESSTFGAAADNQVLGNFIGTDASGTAAIGAQINGISVLDAVGTDVGASDAGNLVCGSSGEGVLVQSVAGPPALSSDTLIAGNTIGLAADCLTPLPNSSGINIFAMNQVTIGGITPVLGNTISGNTVYGMLISSSDDAMLVQGNLVGVAADGVTAVENSIGVCIDQSSSVTVGGSVEGAGNVISGNGSSGVSISNSGDPTQGGNWLLRNYVGTDDSATIAVPNSPDGVAIYASSMNRIGSGVAGDGNVISGNDDSGVHIDGGHVDTPSTGNEVLGNLIGVAGDAVSPLPNGGYGVVLASAVEDSRVGGTAMDERNVIAYNGIVGIGAWVSTPYIPRRISMRGNSIHSNGALGIDLQFDGATPNDPGDVDDGANGLQNYPELSAANSVNGRVSGQLDSAASTTFAVDLFASSVCDSSGYGEGEVYLGSTSVTTDGAGIGTFYVSDLAFSEGQYLSATATDPDGNTSELSQCVLAEATSEVFADDFESGDLSAWSAAMQ